MTAKNTFYNLKNTTKNTVIFGLFKLNFRGIAFQKNYYSPYENIWYKKKYFEF